MTQSIPALAGGGRASELPRRHTIIKRKRRVDFTVLGNVLINDSRLELDEMAAAVKLLSKPNDWQVHPGQLRSEWGIGRERCYRILSSLIRCGYIVRGEMLRRPGGQFVAVEYIIHDEPQSFPDTVDDVFDGGDDAGPDDRGGASPGQAPGGGNTVAFVPQPGLPHAAEPHTANPHGEVTKDTRTKLPPLPPDRASDDSPAQAERPDDRQAAADAAPRAGASPPLGPGRVQSAGPLDATAPPPARKGSGPPVIERADSPRLTGSGVRAVPTFEEFWREYRPENWMSEVAAQRRWVRLSDPDKTAAFDGLVAVFNDRREKNWRRPNAATYLRDRLWRGFVRVPASKPALIQPHTPQWHRWRERHAADTPDKAKLMESFRDMKRDWWEASEWPPARTETQDEGGST